MSIDLPRSHRPLHFTGSVKALAPERPANAASALGQERPKGPLPSPTPRALGGIRITTPTPVAVAVAEAVKLTTMRGQLASMDEDLVTDALDSGKLEAALFPIAKRENLRGPAPNLPIPGFRSVKDVQGRHAPPAIINRAQKGGGSLPLGVWLGIALIAAIVSFNLAPEAAESVTAAVRALDAR